jgi:S1-C subfamily serine protease
MTPPSAPDARMAKWILLMTLLLALAARLAAGADAAAKPDADLYERAKRASVEVLVDDHLDGSGWFADAKGLVLTAAHVVNRPDRRIEVLSPVAGRLPAKIVAVDHGFDLLLLQVEPREGGYPTLALADRVPPASDDVFLFAASMYRHGLLLRGMVARDDTTFEYYGDQHRYIEVVHVAANVQQNNSGGPWMNHRGEVVGLQSGMFSLHGVPVGVAHMIPVAAIRGLLKNRRSAATPTLGAAVEETWQQQRDFLNRYPPRTEGLVVKVLQNESPASRAGLKQWDVIVAADGQKVRLPDELLRIVRGKQPGQALKLDVLGPDGAGSREATVSLGKLENGWPGAAGEE